jgi:hypothetical protein
MPLKSILTVSLFLFCLKGFAQPFEDGEYNRIAKVNLASLLVKNVSGQYEMILSQKVSVALGFRYAPYVGLPFKHLLAKINNENADVTSIFTKTSVTNFAVTPEVRYYLGRGYGEGFYIAPYYRYLQAKADYVPLNYTSSTNGTKWTMTISGDMYAHTGGVMVGAQWPIGERFSLDWWMVGAHFGGGKGKLSGRTDTPLSEDEQEQIRQNLDEVNVPLMRKEVTVTANRVTVDLSGPFGGLRSGLTLGFRF